MPFFTVKQEKFEGPFDLLLSLIERRQFHVSDISLARVADDFLAYVRECSEFPLAEGAEFASVTATLLLIKSKSLLPELSLSDEEEASIEELERRLILHKRFTELSRHLRAMFGRTPLFLPRERDVIPIFAPPARLSASLLAEAIKNVAAALPKAASLPQAVVTSVISLEEMIERMTERITRALRMSFREFAQSERKEKESVIVSFLALLELVRRGAVAATQHQLHGDIVMETGQMGTPRYE